MGVYGMTYDEFFRDDPTLAVAYREAYKARRREENNRDWLMGHYLYNAVATALSNGFRGKGKKPTPYMEEPFPIYETQEDREAKQRKQAEKAEAVFKQMIAKQKAEKAAKAAREQQDAEA